MTLYMAVTSDRYELPIAVEQTITDLADRMGVKPNTISNNISRGFRKYIKIDVDVDEGEVIELRSCELCGSPLDEQESPGLRYCHRCIKRRRAEHDRARRNADGGAND